MTLDKPIFIIGCGRSGSTLLHNLLARHPNAAWLSEHCAKNPQRPASNKLIMKTINLPVLGDYIFKKLGPGEYYNFWDYYSKGFSTPIRDLGRNDVTLKTKKNLRAALSQLITRQRQKLFIKITGWPRIGFLREIFQDAKFIHIFRDGRAVVNSLLNVDFWWGWQGPENWRWGALSPSHREEWEKYDRSFLALAAIQWKLLMAAFENTRNQLNPDDVLEVKYESLCEAPLQTISEIAGFCNLDMPSIYRNYIQNQPVKSSNYKWQTELTDEQKSMLDAMLHAPLKQYNYV